MTAVATFTKGGWVRKDRSGRTHQPVRAQSQMTAPEDYPEQKISQHQANRQKKALRELADEGRRPGRRRGSDGNISRLGERVYAFLVDWQARTGRVYPSLAAIAEAVGTTTRVVAVEIRKLAAYGLLAWERRCEPTGRAAGEPGPQVQQTSNYYLMKVPNEVWKRIRSWEKRPRARTDAGLAHDRETRAAQNARYKREERASDVKAARSAYEDRKAAQRARADAYWAKPRRPDSMTSWTERMFAKRMVTRSADGEIGLPKREVPEG